MITAFLVSSLVLFGVILDNFLLIFDGWLVNKLGLFAIADKLVEPDSLLKGSLKESSVLSVLETSCELLKLCFFLREIIASPSVGFIAALHGDKLAQRCLLEDKVGDWLESLLLAHDKAELVSVLVAEELAVAGTTLLPLTISEAIELASDLEDALLFLFSRDLLDLGKLSL